MKKSQFSEASDHLDPLVSIFLMRWNGSKGNMKKIGIMMRKKFLWVTFPKQNYGAVFFCSEIKILTDMTRLGWDAAAAAAAVLSCNGFVDGCY
jgi:hypothetical protein